MSGGGIDSILEFELSAWILTLNILYKKTLGLGFICYQQ